MGAVPQEEEDNKLTLNHGSSPSSSHTAELPSDVSEEPQQQQQQQQQPSSSTDFVALRENEAGRVSKASSKRNSLDNKSVQSLAKDLAAECAKAYELMESSLSKLTNDFSIGPFGLTPKNKVRDRGGLEQ